MSLPASPTLSPFEAVSAMIEEQGLTKEQLLTYLRQIMEIRALENNIANLLSKAVLKGDSHLYAGQEAVAVGAVAALRRDDLITSTHRGHGHAHAHGDSVAATPEARQNHYNKMMAEVLGKSGGYCKGKGSSMHIADVEHGNLGATGIVGGNIPVALGAAMAGMRPVAKIMYVDFTPLAMGQITNQGAKNRYMFGGKTTVPMVIRTEGSAGRAIAAHHSQSLESLWTHFPGIYVVMPATPYDAKGLLKAAIRDDNPVMFIEHKMLYKEKGPVPEEEYIIPFGVADVKRPGKDVTLVSYSRMVLRSLEAVETLAQEGVDVEVIDLRTLNPLDIETIVASVKKTGRLVCVSEAYENTGFINEVMARVNELAFDWLDAPMLRVAAANVPVPRAEILEDQAIPNVGRILAACRKAVA
ncbi:MAG: thiamine pyrophosphate-dependent enzyme [Chloroflexi bacterium]|nr:thiamine pyrophosphate-dependent enzyme [Chloroflexota bacterium]